MENTFTVNKSVEFIAPHSIYYKGTDIMEYCWNRLTYCGEVDVNEILADAENVLIPETMTIGRFMEIINTLRRENLDNTFTSYNPEDCENMTMDDIFGKGNTIRIGDGISMVDIFGEDDNNSDDEDFTDDEGVTYDKCCCDSSVYCDEFHSHITLADLNFFFDTLNFKSDNSSSSANFSFDTFDANDSLNRMLDSLDDMNFNFDDSEPDDDIFEDNFNCTFESFDEYDKVMNELLNDYTA